MFAGAYRDLRTGPQIVLTDRLLNPIQIRGEVVDYIHHRPVVAGGAMPWHPKILAYQLTLSQPGGADYAIHITTGTPGFSDLSKSLHHIGLLL